MKCPPPFPARVAGILLTAALALAGPAASHAAPAAAQAASASASSPKAAAKKKKKSGRAATSKTAKRGKTDGKNVNRRGSGKAAAAGTAATAGAAAASVPADATAPDTPPETGIRLPLMLRTTPALPDDPTVLQSRLDSVVAMQGAAGEGARVDGVRQLGPDIYAFALHCRDAEQCQRMRLAIEEEREWVAGLQLDERRQVPKPPAHRAPAAR